MSATQLKGGETPTQRCWPVCNNLSLPCLSQNHNKYASASLIRTLLINKHKFKPQVSLIRGIDITAIASLKKKDFAGVHINLDEVFFIF